MATTSQPRSLLSMARLNRARSRVRRSSCSLVLIDHTWLGLSGGFAPGNLPLFQGIRRDELSEGRTLLSFIGLSPCLRNKQGCCEITEAPDLTAAFGEHLSEDGYYGRGSYLAINFSAWRNAFITRGRGSVPTHTQS